MWEMWIGRILIFSNAVVPAVAGLFGIEFGWWNALYGLVTAVAAFLVGQFGKR
jgi:hypothetical protein